MSCQLKVYNRFEELILNVRFVPGDPLPIQIEDGTPELQRAVCSMSGHDFDETVIVGGQRQRFEAKWGTAEYLDALAAYWSSNFGWQTRVIETAPTLWNLQTQSLVGNPKFFTMNYVELPEASSQVTENCRLFERSGPIQYHNYYLADVGATSELENLGATISASTFQSGNLFVAQPRAHTFFSLQPLQQSFDMSQSIGGQFSLAWGVSQPTATALLKKHDPGIHPSIRVQDALAA